MIIIYTLVNAQRAFAHILCRNYLIKRRLRTKVIEFVISHIVQNVCDMCVYEWVHEIMREIILTIKMLENNVQFLYISIFLFLFFRHCFVLLYASCLCIPTPLWLFFHLSQTQTAVTAAISHWAIFDKMLRWLCSWLCSLTLISPSLTLFLILSLGVALSVLVLFVRALNCDALICCCAFRNTHRHMHRYTYSLCIHMHSIYVYISIHFVCYFRIFLTFYIYLKMCCACLFLFLCSPFASSSFRCLCIVHKRLRQCLPCVCRFWEHKKKKQWQKWINEKNPQQVNAIFYNT